MKRFSTVPRLRPGFTIVELLIVVVVIAILAAIAIVAYSGIRNRAIDASLTSDLRNAANLVEIDMQTTGSYPATAALANNGKGLKSSSGTTLTYLMSGNAYCIFAQNGTRSFRTTSSSKRAEAGVCGLTATVSTLAGSGTAGFADNSNGQLAQFNFPDDIAVDGAGNVYVADTNNHRIRKVTPTGSVSTHAGSGVQGFADANGTAAQFSNPSGVAVDGAGNVYVGESNRIRVISPARDVGTFSGSGTSGSLDGPSATARYGVVKRIGLLSSGGMYVIDAFNGYNVQLRSVSATGTVTSLTAVGSGATNGPVAGALFSAARSIAVASNGDAYIADSNNSIIRLLSAGTVSTFAGSGTPGGLDGALLTAQFRYANGIAINSSGTIYVADSVNHTIRMIAGGTVSTLAGSGVAGSQDAVGTSAQFNNPNAIAIGPDGNLYVADSYGNKIRKVTLTPF